DVASALAEMSATSGKTTVACFLGVHGVTDALSYSDPTTTDTADESPSTIAVPGYPSPEDAVWALAAVTNYAHWRRADHGHLVDPEGVAPRRAARLVSEWLTDAGSDGMRLDPSRVAELLDCYGIEVLSSRTVSNAEDAVAAADDLGWPVALKA